MAARLMGYVSASNTPTIVSPTISYKYHIFTSSGTLTVTTGGYMEAIVVGGGGGGGAPELGGGGGGGAISTLGFGGTNITTIKQLQSVKVVQVVHRPQTVALQVLGR